MQQYGRNQKEEKIMPLQQYAETEAQKIRQKYGQKIAELREKPDETIRAIESKQHAQDSAYKRNIWKIDIAAFFISLTVAFIMLAKKDLAVKEALFSLFAISCGSSVAVHLICKTLYKNGKESSEKRIKTLQNQLDASIQVLQAQQQEEIKQLSDDLNNKINQYCKTFLQNRIFAYPAAWIINALSAEIGKADRSAWNPQVKAFLTFTVTNKSVEIPNYGKYDMATQGIFVDPNPLAVTALTHVLEQMTMTEARNRFQKDPGGGRPVFQSNRNDYQVSITYSAPNGGAAAK